MANTVNVTTAEGTVAVTIEQMQFDRSVTPGATPLPAQLLDGALAINLADLALFTKNDVGAIVKIGANYDAALVAVQEQIDAISVTAADVGLDQVQNYAISDSYQLDNSQMYASSKAVNDGVLAAAASAQVKANTAETNAKAYTDQEVATLSTSVNGQISTLVLDYQTYTDDAVGTQAIASQTYTDNAISALVDGAPTALDTLNELAAALSNDGDAIASLTTEVDARLRITTFDAYKAGGSSVVGSMVEDNFATPKAVTTAYLQSQDYALTLMRGVVAKLDLGRSF